MLVTILTLFPEIFPGPLGASLVGKALRKKLWDLHVVDLKLFGLRGRRDSPPRGGGSGMVLSPEIVDAALSSLAPSKKMRKIFLSPRGRVFNQKEAEAFSREKKLLLLCGRYEGVDVRAIEKNGFEEVSMGDFVLTGGETAAMALIEASVRLLPGIVGDRNSLRDESFAEELLEYSHYTGPVTWEGREVPVILRSGDHQAIRAWRLHEAQRLTRTRRPDLWRRYVSHRLEKSIDLPREIF